MHPSQQKRDQPGILGQACPSGSWWPQGWGSKPCGSEIVVPSRPASEARSPLHCRPSERINRLELTVEPAELTVEPAESSQDQPCGPQPASERSSTPSANEGKFTVVVPKRVLYTDDCTSASVLDICDFWLWAVASICCMMEITVHPIDQHLLSLPTISHPCCPAFCVSAAGAMIQTGWGLGVLLLLSVNVAPDD